MIIDMQIPLPGQRSTDYYNEGDKVRIYFEKEGVIIKSKWYKGVVKLGYRHHDGCVSYKLEGIGPTGEEKDFKGWWGCGSAIPMILKEEVYKHFRKNPEEYHRWCQSAYDKVFNGEKVSPAIIPGTEAIWAKMELIKE